MSWVFKKKMSFKLYRVFYETIYIICDADYVL